MLNALNPHSEAQQLAAEFNQLAKEWDKSTIILFQRRADIVGVYLEKNYDLNLLSASTNQLEVLQMIHFKKITPKLIPVIFSNVDLARELSKLPLPLQEEIIDKGVEIVRNRKPAKLAIQHVKPKELERAIIVENGAVRLMSAQEQLRVIEYKPNPTIRSISIEVTIEQYKRIMDAAQANELDIQAFCKYAVLGKTSDSE